MSRQLLEALNGGQNSRFAQELDRTSGEPRIAWYPSEGSGYRDRLYLSEAHNRYNPPQGVDPLHRMM